MTHRSRFDRCKEDTGSFDPKCVSQPLPNHRINAIEEYVNFLDPVFLICPVIREEPNEVLELGSVEPTHVDASKSSSKEPLHNDETLLGLYVDESPSCLHDVAATYNPRVMGWMRQMKFVPGLGLAKENQGIIDILQPKTNPRVKDLGLI